MLHCKRMGIDHLHHHLRHLISSAMGLPAVPSVNACCACFAIVVSIIISIIPSALLWVCWRFHKYTFVAHASSSSSSPSSSSSSSSHQLCYGVASVSLSKHSLCLLHHHRHLHYYLHYLISSAMGLSLFPSVNACRSCFVIILIIAGSRTARLAEGMQTWQLCCHQRVAFAFDCRAAFVFDCRVTWRLMRCLVVERGLRVVVWELCWMIALCFERVASRVVSVFNFQRFVFVIC